MLPRMSLAIQVMRRLQRTRCLRVTIAAAIVCFVSVLILLRLTRSLAPPPNDRDPNAPSSICHTPQCIASFESLTGHTKRIPSIRHILWKSDNVSRYFADQLKTWHEIQPDWKYVLWRDSDMDKFVAKHYPGVREKFQSLPHFIMRIDMIRYMILHKFGGVYADLDYILVRRLDRFQKFPAVVTRETEVHSLFHFGMRDWPPPLLANPAFLMSEPRNPFFQFCIAQLAVRPSAVHFMEFAGPLGLSDLLLKFFNAFPVAASPELAVYVPASNSFYPYKDNNMKTSTSVYQDSIRSRLRRMCFLRNFIGSSSRNLTEYCSNNVLVLDPLTDAQEPVYAIHDNLKARSSYDTSGSPVFNEQLVLIRSVLPTVVMADSIY